MKKNIHPEQREVLFRDIVTGEVFLVKSTAEAGESMVWTDGKEYPVVNCEITSSSHPAFKDGAHVEAPATPRAVQFAIKYQRETLH